MDPYPAGLRGARILVVEDSADIREVFTLLLESEGATVVSTGSGREALKLAAGAEFDILLTDLGLPDVPGDMVIRQAIATARQRPRVVVVTGYGEPFVGRARRAGADAIVQKPVTWAELVSQLVPATPAPVAA